MVKHFVLLLVLITSLQIKISAQGSCGSDAVHQHLLQDPTYVEQFSVQAQMWAKSQTAFNKIVPTSNGLMYELPTVVHIIHSGEQPGTFYNPSDQQIMDLINFFNESFLAESSLTADTLSGGVRVPIRLVLAARDPSCNATNGIMRVNGSVYPDYFADGVRYLGTTGVQDTAIKALSLWPRDSYVNIWLVNKIDNGSWSGYATFPAVSPAIDGIMMGAFIAQQPYTSLTFAHEMGHFLGLLHTFWGSNGNNCPPNANCSIDGDDICDTEPHTMPSGCPSGINNCTGVNYNNVQYNIMNYTNCTDRFTKGQSAKMLFTLNNFRQSLLSSYGSMAPGTNPPALSQPPNTCTPAAITNTMGNFNVGVQDVKLSNLFVHSSGYDRDGKLFYIDRTIPGCLQPQSVAHLHRDSTYLLTVTTGANPEYVRGWIDFDNNGTFSASELVISKNGSLSFETHTVDITVPPNALTCTPLRFRLASDMIGTTPQPCSNPQYGQVEDFIVVINTSIATVTISANPGLNVNNGTIVNFSATASNGGNAPLYEWFKNGQAIPGATAAVWTTSAGVGFNSGDIIFVKMNSNAVCTQPSTVKSNVLSPTLITNTITGIHQHHQAGQINLYPNPSRGEFTITAKALSPGSYHLLVTNVLGQTVYDRITEVNNGQLESQIDLLSQRAGVYYLSFLSGQDVIKVIPVLVTP